MAHAGRRHRRLVRTESRPPERQRGRVVREVRSSIRSRRSSGNTGTNPRDEVSQWGSNIDGNYLNKIRTAIAQQYYEPERDRKPTDTKKTGSDGVRWDENWFRSNIGVPNNMSDLLAMQGKIEAAGGQLNKNASGQWNGKITTPDGRIVDIMIAAGKGGTGFQWDEGGNGGSLLDPFPESAPNIRAVCAAAGFRRTDV
jgi:hypothetical protein